MRDSRMPDLNILLGVSAFVAAVTVFSLFYFAERTGATSATRAFIDHKLKRENEAYQKLHLDLVDPNEAPISIRSLAKLGFQAMLNTNKFAPDYVGDKLNCTSCHFAAGNTTGGAQGGISLVGSATMYPAYDPSLKKVVSLQERINSCFTRSMSGKPLPLDSDLMLAFTTYLQWISKDLPVYGNPPWLGLTQLITTHLANPKDGKRTYDTYCALCHRDDGQGGEHSPPLWGENSFNRAAGMNHLPTLASFIYWNMPYDDTTPILSEAESLDVAAYILSKPRQ